MFNNLEMDHLTSSLAPPRGVQGRIQPGQVQQQPLQWRTVMSCAMRRRVLPINACDEGAMAAPPS